jgi:hypothetical protein
MLTRKRLQLVNHFLIRIPIEAQLFDNILWYIRLDNVPGLFFGRVQQLTKLERIKFQTLEQPGDARHYQQKLFHKSLQILKIGRFLGRAQQQLVARSRHLVKVITSQLILLGLVQAKLGLLNDLIVDETRRRVQIEIEIFVRVDEQLQILFHLSAGFGKFFFEFFIVEENDVRFVVGLGGRAAQAARSLTVKGDGRGEAAGSARLG